MHQEVYFARTKQNKTNKQKMKLKRQKEMC